jgi:hypothetical protein
MKEFFLRQFPLMGGILLGGMLGYAWYFFAGCENGCPIQSQPFPSTAYGALMGAMLFTGIRKTKSSNES